MFPQIKHKKKIPQIGSQQMQKQCQSALKQIQLKHSQFIKSLPSQLTTDYHRVCKLKNIPSFYSQYFTCFTAQSSSQYLQKHFDQEIDNMMLDRSCYDKISTLIKQRLVLLTELKQQMHKINLTSSSLEIKKLTNFITNLRENLKQIIESVISWQFWLRSLCESERQRDENQRQMSVKQMKIIFPEGGINCIFIGLYDLQFLRDSFLNKQIEFSHAEFDPFLIEIQPSTRISKVLKQTFYIPLSSISEQYRKVQKYLIDCIPLNKNNQQQSYDKNELSHPSTPEKVFRDTERPMSKQMRRMNKKLFNGYASTKIVSQKLESKHNQLESFTSKINQPQQLIKSISKQKLLSISKNSVQESGVRYRTMSNISSNSTKRISNIYKLSSASNSNNSNKNNSNNNHKKSLLFKVIHEHVEQPNNGQYLQRVVRQKEQLMKELKSQKKEQQQLRRIIKQVESRTSYEHRLFQQKTQQYQQQLYTLKGNVRQREIKYNSTHQEQQQSLSNLNSNKLVTKVYQHNNRKSQSSLPLVIDQKYERKEFPYKDIQERIRNQLLQKASENRLLEQKISQLIMEKTKLERLIQKQGIKADKSKNVYEKKILKYQQTIQRLKYQTSSSKALVEEIKKRHSAKIEQDLMARRLQRQQSITRLYASSRNSLLKATNHQKIRASPVKTLPILQQPPTFHKIESLQQHSKTNFKNPHDHHQQQRLQRSLMITKRRNAIEILYNSKKHDKEPKHNNSSQQQQVFYKQQQSKASTVNNTSTLQQQREYLIMSSNQKMQNKQNASVDIQNISKSNYLENLQATYTKQTERNIKQNSSIDLLPHPFYQVYQQFIPQNQLTNYLNKIISLSSHQTLQLNHNSLLFQLVQQVSTLVIIIAKDPQKQIQIGITIFHKQYHSSEYICDYLLVHDMSKFMAVIFNFTKFIFQHDLLTQNVMFNFNKMSLAQQESKRHFGVFQDKCKRFGQVFVNSNQSQASKYVLKRELFQEIDQGQCQDQEYKIEKQQKGMVLSTKLQVHQRLMRAKQPTSSNHKQLPNDINTFPTLLLSFYLNKNQQLLQSLKSSHNIKYPQLISISTILSQKQIALKELTQRVVRVQEKVELYSRLGEWFDIDDVEKLKIQEVKISVQETFYQRFKRCSLDINKQSIKYCMFPSNQQLIKRCQSSNSKQTGTFLSIIPKHNLLIIPASQFLTLSHSNPEISIFSYARDFINNIASAKTLNNISRVFLPEIKFTNWNFYKDLSQKLDKTIIKQEQIKIGYEGKIDNSVVYSPRKSDLLIQKPFIICMLSTVVENVLQGSPLICTLVC